MLLEISVTDMLGQRVLYETGVSSQLNISQLQNGVYLLTAKDTVTGKTYHTKVIKTTY